VSVVRCACVTLETEDAPAAYEVLETFVGYEYVLCMCAHAHVTACSLSLSLARCSSTLVGKKYVPLFDYFVESYKTTGFRVVADTYVTDDAGTGVCCARVRRSHAC
jgi:isoleucyl-tRNA synthetase